MSEKKEKPQLSEFEWIALIALCCLIAAFAVVAFLHREPTLVVERNEKISTQRRKEE